MDRILYVIAFIVLFAVCTVFATCDARGQTQIDTLQSVAASDGGFKNNDAPYLTARNAAVGDATDNDDVIIGQTPGFTILRGVVVFKLHTISPLPRNFQFVSQN